MPRRDDLSTILIIGSGPIVIGQGCEFDYSGTQACKALREEGYHVVLVNSNPATIMTDPQFSDRTYIEPITPEAVTKIIEKERGGKYQIDALLPTLGGQTALNCACALYDDGTLDKYGIEMIGADRAAIYRAEDRREFKEIVEGLGLQCPVSGIANTMNEAWAVLENTGLPAIIRPAFTLGGSGGGVAYNREEFEDIARRGLDASMNHQILIDQSLLGWKEYELEVMRDKDDNVVIICAIENFDPMGVHTGDSITVAPAQTLTDKEYQRLRDASLAIIRAIGVETGGSNIQFGVNPANGDVVVIEMNPRVSRSSALASKATGFPIAKIAAKLAIGYTLPELPNDITGETVACFEPTIDYVVTKIPRWTFEKFPEANETLTTQMKSVGEGMSIGRTFKESLQKGIRSMEVKRFGFGLDGQDKWLQSIEIDDAPDDDIKLTSRSSAQPPEDAGDAPPDASQPAGWPIPDAKLRRKLEVPSQGRLYYIRYALKMDMSLDEIHELTRIDPWFLDQLKQLTDFENELLSCSDFREIDTPMMLKAKQWGYSDAQLAQLFMGGIHTELILAVRAHRQRMGVRPIYKLVDTCAAEFAAVTPYFYSTYETPYCIVGEPRRADADTVATRDGSLLDDEIRISDKPKIIILGGGPNRIGQGIEFDYCCVQAVFAARELGYEAVMINSNPETVSTDYDTSDLLFFEPLTLEDVLNVCERLNGGPFTRAGASTPPASPASGTGDGPARGLVKGVIVQFGGQTPLNLAAGLEQAGVPIIGTSVDAIDLAEDRERFADLCNRLDIRQPENGIAYNVEEAVLIARRIGYPVLVRPSFVLGGRAMETVFDEAQLRKYMVDAIGASDLAGQPILVDKFLFQATECDVDVIADYGAAEVNPSAGRGLTSAVADGRALVCGVLEHIEEAGIHSGDSACAIPPYSLKSEMVELIKSQSRKLAEALQVRGLMNAQWAVRHTPQGDELYVIEVNPRASRTVPFIGKATGVAWANLAAKVMAGKQLHELGVTEEVVPRHTSVKESVFPFGKFPGVDVILGPEMRSTGECMGADYDFPIAFAKSQIAAGTNLPTSGKIFLSVREDDKPAILDTARRLRDLGFDLITTGGTHDFLQKHDIKSTRIRKIQEGGRPNAIDLIKNGDLAMLINTATKKGAGTDEGKLRATAVRFGLPMITTATAAAVAARAIAALQEDTWQVRALQDYFPQ